MEKNSNNNKHNNKPDFIRQEYGRIKLERVWRKPKGIHSKMRRSFKGKRKKPSPGYGSPSAVRGLHTGLKPLLVYNISMLPKSKEYGIIIASNVGMRKKLEIIKKAGELGLSILNIKPEDYVKNAEELFAAKKKAKEKAKKEPKKEGTEKKREKEEVKPEPKHDEKKQIDDKQKAEEEKIEKDKLLTKRT